jgi:antibiotic biosynthesis monooxygenase (ABM) superfamily enzyme
MFGTVGRAKLKAENREKFVETLQGQANESIPGMQKSYVLFPENRPDEVLMVVFFDDRDSYMKNADDPEQHKRWEEYSQYFESEPEWHDGEWLES